jgi:hypothetical protein
MYLMVFEKNLKNLVLAFLFVIVTVLVCLPQMLVILLYLAKEAYFKGLFCYYFKRK